MALENTWIGYLNRSYKDIKKSLVTRLKNKVPEITDRTESNIVIIIIDMMAGLLEQLHYYIDNIARECFLLTAKRYTSVLKIAYQLDYRVRSSSGAYADLLFNTLDEDGLPKNTLVGIIIPKDTIINTDDGISYMTTRAGAILAGTNYCIIPAIQRSKVTGSVLGVTNGNQSQTINLPIDYCDDTLEITIGTDTYERVDSFGYSGPLDKHFTVKVNENKIIQLVFGDGLNGVIPLTNQNIVGTYYTTKGSNGRVSAGLINTFANGYKPSLVNTGTSDISVTNQLASVGGTPIDGIEEIRIKAPLSIRTLNRAVTPQDFIDLALLVNGVAKVGLEYTVENGLELFISPVGGGIATDSLLAEVETYFEKRSMLPITPIGRAAGETELLLSLDVVGKYRITESAIRSSVLTELLNKYSFENMAINNKIRTSDIIASVDNLPEVDYLSLVYISTKPYARPSSGAVSLDWAISVLQTSTETFKWSLYFNGPDFHLFKNGVFLMALTIGQSYTVDDIMTLTINNGLYNTGDTWDFTTYNYNRDLVIDDNTIPILKESNITLNVTEIFQ